MKISYIKCNEPESDIRIESDVDLNEQITEQDERDMLMIHCVHQIIKSYASGFDLILRNCSYNITSDSKNEIEFHLVIEGHPKIIAMLMISVHTSIAQNSEIDLDLFHGTVTTLWDGEESIIAFKAEAKPASKKQIQH